MNVVIFGATSAIAQATARLYAQQKAQFFLVARDKNKLEQVGQDLTARGAHAVHLETGDMALDADQTRVLAALAGWQHPDVALVAWGTLPEQRTIEKDGSKTLQEFHVNGTSVIRLLADLSPLMEKGKSGTIAVISSVAGDRGRYSNYVYGAAKAAVSVYTQGLRARLSHQGIHVLTIKPGFVDTPMTASFKKGALWATPDVVAKGIVNAINRKRNIAYLPWFWWGIMTIIRLLPEEVSKRLKY